MPDSYERSNTYERVVDGRVVERSSPLDGDYEDTRLGLLALDGTDGWRVAGAEPEPSTGESAENMPADIPGVDQAKPEPAPAQPTANTTKGDVTHGANRRRR